MATAKPLPRKVLDAPLALAGKDGTREATLSDHAGRWLVLYFYPKDNTPGCTTEGRDFAALLPKFRKLGADILGVLARLGALAPELLRQAGLRVRAGERSRRNALQRVRSDQGKTALRPQVHRHRTQYVPDRSRIPRRAKLARRESPRPRPGRARCIDLAQEALMTRSPRIYVLDTNVLMHDPTALFKFEEHDVYLPMQVMEELDNAKKGTSEPSRNARQVSRFLNELIESQGVKDIAAGIPLANPNGLQLRGKEAAGRLRFQIANFDAGKRFGAVIPDNHILGAILALKDEEPGTPVVFISKDINLRIKAAIAGIDSEDYENDRALDDFSLLYTGATELPEDFWSIHGKELKSWTEKGRTFYEIARRDDDDWYPNQFLFLPGEEEAEMKVARVNDAKVVLQIVDDYRHTQHAVWGIAARNREQNFALNALMDPDIDFVSLLGTAGTGKTLLALAAGLAQTMDQQRYREIIMTRATVSVGEDIGFLPGTEKKR
jgi:PhoH-like ATPase